MTPEVPLCEVCGRKAVAHVVKKYPAKTKLRKYVCGLHLRPYKTSEFRKHMIETKQPKPHKLGYAPEGM